MVALPKLQVTELAELQKAEASGSDDGTCVGEFEQCAGKKDGKSFISACCNQEGTDFWCAQFGDWWGLCLPAHVFPNHRDPHEHDRDHQERGRNG